MPQSGVPTKPPVFRNFDFGALVRKAWGDAWHQKETAYDFSNGRKFEDSGSHAGIYSGTSA